MTRIADIPLTNEHTELLKDIFAMVEKLSSLVAGDNDFVFHSRIAVNADEISLSRDHSDYSYLIGFSVNRKHHIEISFAAERPFVSGRLTATKDNLGILSSFHILLDDRMEIDAMNIATILLGRLYRNLEDSILRKESWTENTFVEEEKAIHRMMKELFPHMSRKKESGINEFEFSIKDSLVNRVGNALEASVTPRFVLQGETLTAEIKAFTYGEIPIRIIDAAISYDAEYDRLSIHVKKNYKGEEDPQPTKRDMKVLSQLLRSGIDIFYQVEGKEDEEESPVRKRAYARKKD